MTGKVFKAAFISSLPVLMGYSAMGMAAGILLAGTVKLHALPFWAFLSSGINISGAFIRTLKETYGQEDIITSRK